MNFFTVANQQGKDAYFNERELAHLMAEASQHHSGKTVEKTDTKAKDLAPVTTDCELTRGLYEPKHFATATSGTGHRWSQVPHPKLTHMTKETTANQARWNPDAMVYADGSFKKDTNLTGSGIYGFKDGIEVHIKVRPSKPGPVYTINRVEMIAIHEALRQWEQCDNVSFATDSANAMKSINKQLRNPHKHNKHVHKTC